MWTGCFKKLLKVVLGRMSLSCEITFSSRYEPPIGVISFLSVVAIAGHCSKVTRSVLLPLLIALSVFSGALDGGLSGSIPATISSFSRVT
jgi:hypothetical protein